MEMISRVNVTNMHCSNCALTIEHYFNDLKNIKARVILSENIVIFTNHLKIDGTIHEFKGKCADCHDCVIALKDVTVCRLEDYCTCNHDECECNDYICFKYDWLNVNIAEVVAFSIVI